MAASTELTSAIVCVQGFSPSSSPSFSPSPSPPLRERRRRPPPPPSPQPELEPATNIRPFWNQVARDEDDAEELSPSEPTALSSFTIRIAEPRQSRERRAAAPIAEEVATVEDEVIPPTLPQFWLPKRAYNTFERIFSQGKEKGQLNWNEFENAIVG